MARSARVETVASPFAKVFVALAQSMGVEIDQFGSSTDAGANGLEGGGGEWIAFPHHESFNTSQDRR